MISEQACRVLHNYDARKSREEDRSMAGRWWWKAILREGRVAAKAQRLESSGSPRELRMVQRRWQGKGSWGEKDGKRNQKGRKQEAEGLKHKAKGIWTLQVVESLGSFLRWRVSDQWGSGDNIQAGSAGRQAIEGSPLFFQQMKSGPDLTHATNRALILTHMNPFPYAKRLCTSMYYLTYSSESPDVDISTSPYYEEGKTEARSVELLSKIENKELCIMSLNPTTLTSSKKSKNLPSSITLIAKAVPTVWYSPH